MRARSNGLRSWSGLRCCVDLKRHQDKTEQVLDNISPHRPTSTLITFLSAFPCRVVSDAARPWKDVPASKATQSIPASKTLGIVLVEFGARCHADVL